MIVGDDAFVGSRSMVTEGARVGEGAVLGAGTLLNPSIAVIDAESGDELSRGAVPPWSVVVNASRRREYPGGEFFVHMCARREEARPGHQTRQGEAGGDAQGARCRHLTR